MSSNTLLVPERIAIINEYHDPKSEGYCTKCGKELYKKYKSQLEGEIAKLSEKIKKKIWAVPVVSTHSPLNWDYNILGMVTGQTTTGTGVISEFTSSFTDLFGAQSGQYNKKIQAGENMCFAQLRKKTLDAGGNAVIATDIDYSEIGGEKGMIMVCMAGTAVNLQNADVLGENKSKRLKELGSVNERLRHLLRLKI